MQLKFICMPLRYAGAFAILATIPALYFLNSFAPLATIILILIAILLGEQKPVQESGTNCTSNARIARLLPILYIPAQLAVTVWGVFISRSAYEGEVVSLALPVGLAMGIFGVLAAHEMVHSRSRAEQCLGILLLTGMCYRHFRIAHVFGHHRLAGTEGDPSTAIRGENFYVFLLRTMRGQMLFSWRFEQRRCRSKGLSWRHNRCFHDLSIAAFLCLLIFVLLGSRATIFFLLQSAVAILVLELFNYVAHYGLFRRRNTMGLLEPFGVRHAWNMSAPLANLMLLNMGRHSDHHRRAAAPYQTLQPLSHSPELPAGYAGSIVIALIPPLWRHVMDKELANITSLEGAPHTA